MKRERKKGILLYQIPFPNSFHFSLANSSMKNTLRCCISCIFPCGSLDVIRIIHANGRVEEINRTVRASQIMEAYPNHVLKKPSSPSDVEAPKIVVVSPEAELQRGKIYFLMPAPVLPSSKKCVDQSRRKREKTNVSKNINSDNNHVMSDRYLSEILSEKVVSSSTGKDRRRGRAGVWRPHLESISENITTTTTEVML